MIRGQPGLDELEFDDLYNNLKVYEHELKGVSTSSSQNIAFLSTEVKGSTLKQSTADPDNISKGYTQATSSKVHTAPKCASHSDEIICSFFAQQASMPTTHDDEDLLQIDEDAMEEIDIRWQVAMITARIRKFMRKTGRPIDLKPKNGITFDKSKIECFNCQKLGHFARECRFAKYQENRANGRNEKRIVAIEDSHSKALVATDNNEDIDWTKEFDAEPGFETRRKTKGIRSSLKRERDDFKIKLEKWSNAAVLKNEVLNKQRYLSDKTCIGFGVEYSSSEENNNSSGDETLVDPSYENFKREKAYKAVPPPTEKTKTSQPEIDRNKVIIEDWVDSDDEETDFSEIQKKTVFNSENSETSFENKSPNSQNSVGQESRTKGGNPEEDLKDYAIIDSGCSRRKREPCKRATMAWVDFEKVSYVEELKFNLLSVSQICDKKHNILFTDKECLILSPKFKFVDEDLVILRAPRKNDVYSLDLKNIIPSGGITCLVAKATKDEAVPYVQKSGACQLQNINKLVNDNLVRSFTSKHSSLIHIPLACRKGKQHRASCKKIEERTVREPLELLHMDLFGPVSVESVNRKKYCLVVTDDCRLENKLRHKVKTIRVTRKVQDCLHVNFLENQENQKGKGPDWMFDLELLTPSMNYIPVRKENYADSGGNISTHDDVDDLDAQQFIVHGPNIHAAQNKLSEERTANNEVPLSSEEQALHDELDKNCSNSIFHLSTANTPPQSTGNTPTDSDDDIPKDGVFSTNSFDAEEGGAADYNK
ncbi:putative ribonuclease H-like domain-containing protein [Tanacetum coccineum]